MSGPASRWRSLPLARKAIVVLTLPVLIVLADCAALLVAIQHQNSADKGSRQAAATQTASNALLIEVLNAETSVRGYLASGTSKYLIPFDDAARNLPAATRRLQSLGSDPTTRAQVSRIDSLVEHKLALLSGLRDTRPGPTRTLLLDSSASTMNELRAQLDGFNAAQSTLDEVLRRRAARDRSIATWMAAISVPSSLLAAGLAVALLTVGIVNRIRRIEIKATHLGTGAPLSDPDTGTDEIGRLDAALHVAAGVLRRRESERESAVESARAAAREAEAANAAKGTFLSRISHELRTPLNAVVGFGQLLQMDSASTSDRESVEQIVKAGDHLRQLVNDVLDISSASSGDLRLSLQSVDARAAVNAAAELIAPAAARYGIVIAIVPTSAGNYLICADGTRLRQVLLNLLSNAVKYNRPGGSVTVTIRGRAPNLLRICVHDTGIGISHDDLSRIFLPFERLVDPEHVEGTGLGLTLAKQLTEAMGGRIDAESVEGVGTTFWVEFAHHN